MKHTGIFLLILFIAGFSASVSAQTVQYPYPVAVLGLGSFGGFQIGGQASGYHYQEHVRADQFFAEEYGPKVGVTGSYTKLFSYQNLFMTGDLRLAYGNNTYNGSGTKDGISDFLGEARITGGKDFLFNHFGLSAYTGFGYRNLYDDFGRSTSTDALGYSRDSQYLYLPVGLTPRFRLTDTLRVSTNIEYDYLIRGWQQSNLSDALSNEKDITNNQNTGYGLRGSVMLEQAAWSFGPFFNYWNINASDVKFTNTPYCRLGCYEPHNQTVEVGFQAAYHF